MKRILSLVLALALVLFSVGALADTLFIAGQYEETAKGFGGDVTVTITVSESEITDVTVVGDAETPALGGVAIQTLPEEILKAQTPNVDVLSGATVTSNAIITAATKALEAAGADIAYLDANKRVAAEDAAKEEKTLETEIVIVGAGGAGMAAAIMAHQAGKQFIILEKMPYVGGNTTKATGGMNAAETHYQKEQNIQDSVELFISDTMTGGHNLNDPELVRTMAEKSAGAIEWLDSIGADLPKISFSGGASTNRIHAPADGSAVGNYLVDKFSAKLTELGVEVMLNTKATELIVEDGKIAGVKAEGKDANYTIKAKAVILATGGFGANLEMIAGFRPDLQGTVTTNAPGATGDGIVMAQAVGAALVDIEQIQLHPTVEQTTSMLITESVRGDGAILVNQSGHRFTNELLTRDAVSAAELAQEGQYAYIIFDQHLRDNLKAIEKYVKNGLTVQADTIEELARKLDIYPYFLAMTLNEWNEAVAAQNDAAFGRTTGMDNNLTTAPYYAIQIAPGIHHTMGGVKINTSAQVINTNGDVIPGLFAAGEVTGGVHGGNRLGGNAVADIVIFGRIAAESAIEYCK
ncbi:MAG: flavocytochrome c [Clostridia bacterium]|nr:flavocytochrome c [Clostridia bacterium]